MYGNKVKNWQSELLSPCQSKNTVHQVIISLRIRIKPMKFILSCSLLSIMLLMGCKRTTVKPDPDIPDLPGYSEKGLNNGGILIDGYTWLLEKRGLYSRPLQLLSYPKGDSIVICLNGAYKNPSLKYQNPTTLFLVIKNVSIQNENDLSKLNQKRFVLDGMDNYGGYSGYYGTDKIGKATGQITFGRVTQNNVSVGTGEPGNEIRHFYVMSGRINMKLSSPLVTALTDGRFDVSIIEKSDTFAIYQY